MYFYQSLLSNGIQQLDTVADHWSTMRTAEVTAAHSGKITLYFTTSFTEVRITSCHTKTLTFAEQRGHESDGK